jgi:hypothetical protein
MYKIISCYFVTLVWLMLDRRFAFMRWIFKDIDYVTSKFYFIVYSFTTRECLLRSWQHQITTILKICLLIFNLYFLLFSLIYLYIVYYHWDDSRFNFTTKSITHSYWWSLSWDWKGHKFFWTKESAHFNIY